MQEDPKFATYHEMARLASTENPNYKIHATKRTAHEEVVKLKKELEEHKMPPMDIEKLLRFAYLGTDLHYKVDETKRELE